ncbi:hypothetical protein I5M27_07150 [Adhaeribacter sp. BT258]|uniref:Outer membrane protein beta-barrel domain-containing protein n=1 Tax=Adhaeribacter terrigena TaxID=2793070 RepID=A0ABS1C0R3_9BACT|nr:hypothetical protein [Adhaeribacter terrigena]MBK0402757.1 hypothetical protein [Adhaeribacter terrigena]
MKKIFWFLVPAIALLASSCSSVYMPNTPNTPMLSAKGELYSGGHINLKGNASFTSAYAVSDHIGIMANGSFMNQNRDKKAFRHNILEAGGGYFTTFGEKNNRVLEIYGGLGRGSSDITYRKKTENGLQTYDRQEITLNKVFVQVNFSKKKTESFRLFGRVFPLNYGTALRASYVDMGKFIRNDVEQTTEDNIFLEPIFFTRVLLTNAVQLQHTSGWNFGLKNRDFLTAGNSVSSLGIIINVGGKNLRKGSRH